MFRCLINARALKRRWRWNFEISILIFYITCIARNDECTRAYSPSKSRLFEMRTSRELSYYRILFFFYQLFPLMYLHFANTIRPIRIGKVFDRSSSIKFPRNKFARLMHNKTSARKRCNPAVDNFNVNFMIIHRWQMTLYVCVYACVRGRQHFFRVSNIFIWDSSYRQFCKITKQVEQSLHEPRALTKHTCDNLFSLRYFYCGDWSIILAFEGRQ